MIRLADLDPPHAATLLDRLEAAGIVATTTDVGHGTAAIMGLQRGGLQRRVWIRDEARKPEAEAILHEVLATPRLTTRCPRCGYDLVGHAGATTCPECGLAVLAEAADGAIVCEGCGEESPADFELCWKCGGPLPVTVGDGGPTDSAAPVNACGVCGASMSAGAASCASCGAELVSRRGPWSRVSAGGWIVLASIVLFLLVTLLRGGW